MPDQLIVSLRSDVSLHDLTPDGAVLEFSGGHLPLTCHPDTAPYIHTLLSGGATREELHEIATARGGESARGQVSALLDRCQDSGILCYTAAFEGTPILTVNPMSGDIGFSPDAHLAEGRYCLSRFAYIRRLGDALVLESPLSAGRIFVAGPIGVGLIAALSQPRTPAELCSTNTCIDGGAIRLCLKVLAAMHLVSLVSGNGESAEETNPSLVQWEFHDLMFHSRSRPGGHDYAVGGAYPFLNRVSPLPAIKEQTCGDDQTMIHLSKPDIEALKHSDVPFTDVLERRISLRNYCAKSITAEELGHFLYRSARIRTLTPPNPAQRRYYETSSRPYPSGGAAYDLEIYPIINRCEGIPSGIYHYHPSGHHLRRISPFGPQAEKIIEIAQKTGAMQFRPQVLLTITSRFQRLSWKYRGLSYATTLKNVGALYQTMYLVATAMGLAPCALGKGAADLFAEAAGLDRLAEASVGEFVLGSSPVTRPG